MAFDLNVESPAGRSVFLAVKHGHIGGMSISTANASHKVLSDRFGKVGVITKATPLEISLTSQPACPGTWVFATGSPRVTQKTLPQSPDDRRLLVQFLDSIGYDALSPAARAKQTSLDDEAWAFNAAFAAAAMRVSPGAPWVFNLEK